MESLAAYLAPDRRRALAEGTALPDRSDGAALFADISGFTPFTETLARELGLRRGAEELSVHLNAVYDSLIAAVEQAGGSVVSLSGDAITAWFAGDDGQRALGCALVMQETMRGYSHIYTPSGRAMPLAIKVAVECGPVRRFQVGNPEIQYIDILAGATLDRLAEAEHLAQPGDIIAGPVVSARLGERIDSSGWRTSDNGARCAVVTALRSARPLMVAVPPTPDMDDTQLQPWLLNPVYSRLHTGARQKGRVDGSDLRV